MFIPISNKRSLTNVSVLPTTGDPKLLYRLTTDGRIYAWNTATSKYDTLSNVAPIFSNNIASVTADGQEGQFLYITDTGDEFGNINEIYTWIGGMWSAYPASSNITLPTLYAKEIHVDAATGDDIAGDGTLLKPYKTIAKAITVLNGSGLRLTIHAGTYAESPTFTSPNLTIAAATNEPGGIVLINGTVTINPSSSSIRITGIAMASLVHPGSTAVFVNQCKVNNGFTKSGTGFFDAVLTDFNGGSTITGANTTAFRFCRVAGVTVNNALGNVAALYCDNITVVTVTAGLFFSNASTIYAATANGNAITSTASGTTILQNSNVYGSTGTTTRVNLVGSYSLQNVVFDRANSTLTGTNLGVTEWFDRIGLANLPTSTTNTEFLSINANGQVFRQAVSSGLMRQTVKLGENISAGQAVYVSGTDGTNMIVSKASNDSEAKSSKTIGLLVTGGVTNDLVQVVTEGLLAGLNTSAAIAGDPVWLGVDGNLIFGLANKPVAPAHLVYIGVVTRVQQNNGEIYVKPQNGFELEELHNVLITNLADKQILRYDAATDLWKNSAETQADYTQTNITDPSFVKNKPVVTKSANAPIGSAVTNSVHIQEVSGVIVAAFIYSGSAWEQIYAVQVQADVNELDTTKPSYIKNFPTTFPTSWGQVAGRPDMSLYVLVSALATVATTGNYNDLSNKPNLSVYELAANKGVAGGYAPLNASGKIDAQFLSILGVDFKGTYNAATNTPTLTDGTGVNGQLYLVDVAGTVNHGSGNVTYAMGDGIIYEAASGKWKKIGGQQAQSNLLDISVSDTSNASVYYYGGNTSNGAWQINKWDNTTYTKTIAKQTNNTSITSLASAWAVRTTLTYS